jgi:hypothetical protein
MTSMTSKGLTLMDEFSDAIAACVAEGFDGSISARIGKGTGSG